MKFAYLILGDFHYAADYAEIHNGAARIIGVSSVKQAVRAACELQQDGVDCIELCGAFGKDGAKKILEATQNKIPIGYVTHLPEQDALYREVFHDLE